MVLSCKEIRRQLSNYIDDDISSEMREVLEAHLSQCRHCAAIVDGTRNILVLIADDRAFPMPIGFSERLHVRLRRELEARRKRRGDGVGEGRTVQPMVQKEFQGDEQERDYRQCGDDHHSSSLGRLEGANTPLRCSGAPETPRVEQHPEVEEGNDSGESKQRETNCSLVKTARSLDEYDS